MLLMRCSSSSTRAALAMVARRTTLNACRTARCPSFVAVSHRLSFSSVAAVPDPPSSNHFHQPLVGAQGSVIYTETDEAPALATYSLYPVIAKVSRRPIVRAFFA